MNNRYLFKAKRIDNGEWVQGNLIQSDDAVDDYEAIFIPTENSNIYVRSDDSGDLGFENWCRVNKNTICQCTGLKDDSGDLIFENDILSLEDSVNEIKWKAVVKYGNPNCEYTYGWQLVELTKCEANKDILLWIETEMEYMKCKVIANKFD